MALRFLIDPALAVLTVGFALSQLEGSSPTRVEPTPEGRAPTRAELAPAVEAAFTLESYAPSETAKLVISNRARGIRLQIFQSGPESIVTRSNLTMNGVPVTGGPLDRVEQRTTRRPRAGRRLAERPLLRAPARR